VETADCRQYLPNMKSSHPIRVLTCCYCGARSTMPATPGTALLCHGCGAPLGLSRDLQPALERLPRRPGARRPAIPHPADRPGGHAAADRPARRRKGKRRKSLWQRLGGRVEDIAEDWAEDLADNLLDLFDLD
jgi:hypothetical protein